MNKRVIFGIVKHDLMQLLRSPDYWGPMAVLGILFFVIVPYVGISVINELSQVETFQQIAQAVEALPPAAQNEIPEGLPDSTRVSFAIAVYLLSPVAIIVPLTISVAVGASSIVGERENGTGEFIAHSPVQGSDFFIGKLITAFLPGYMTTIIGFTVYSFLVNATLASEVGYIFFPTRSWLILVLWVMPAFLALGLSLILRISSRVRSTAAAQQASSLVTLPLILVAYGQTSGTVLGAGNTPFIIGGVVWLFAILSSAWGARSFKRSRLLGVANESK
jgi:ABC-2 type transport system permease protein